MADFRIETDRLILREWRDHDFDALHSLCTDPAVMATIGPVHDDEKTHGLLRRLQGRQREHGCTFWAMERKEGGRVVGFCGVSMGTIPQLEGKHEIGWRLASDFWGRSYAREGAEATIDWIKGNRPGEDIWAITSVGNTRSRALMERLGMKRREDMDFAHPHVPDDSRLKAHVTYWLESAI